MRGRAVVLVASSSHRDEDVIRVSVLQPSEEKTTKSACRHCRSAILLEPRDEAESWVLAPEAEVPCLGATYLFNDELGFAADIFAADIMGGALANGTAVQSYLHLSGYNQRWKTAAQRRRRVRDLLEPEDSASANCLGQRGSNAVRAPCGSESTEVQVTYETGNKAWRICRQGEGARLHTRSCRPA